MTVELYDCSNSDYNKLVDGITEFNLTNIKCDNSHYMRALGYVLRDPLQGLIGGITARLLLGNTLSIEILWVYPKFRKQGYGSMLLKALENAARSMGSQLSQVDTFDFQALEFYQKNGYTLFGTLNNSPSVGHQRYYLCKNL